MQRSLATQVTELVHGQDACKKAMIKSSFLFDDDIKTISEKEILNAFKDDPIFVRICKNDFLGKELTDLASFVKITKSKSKFSITYPRCSQEITRVWWSIFKQKQNQRRISYFNE